MHSRLTHASWRAWEHPQLTCMSLGTLDCHPNSTPPISTPRSRQPVVNPQPHIDVHSTSDPLFPPPPPRTHRSNKTQAAPDVATTACAQPVANMLPLPMCTPCFTPSHLSHTKTLCQHTPTHPPPHTPRLRLTSPRREGPSREGSPKSTPRGSSKDADMATAVRVSDAHPLYLHAWLKKPSAHYRSQPAHRIHTHV
jgi:hypothetical protein